jgi:predicted DCC family thiol-disulfide oxidoreductase YuxK
MVFDGNCGFCRAWVARWQAAAQGRVDFEPSTSALLRFPELAAAAPNDAVLLVGTDGSVTRGAAAVLLARHITGAGTWLARIYRAFGPFADAAEFTYKLAARNRGPLSAMTRFLWGSQTEAPSFATAVWVFLRMLGAVYAVAFLSMWVQVSGLIGPDGILPAGDFLKAVSEEVGLERYWFLPTLSWIFGAGWFLHVQCLAGLASGVLIAAGRHQRIALVVAWVCYLSLVVLGQDFTRFQWDILLLESGLVALFLAGSSHRAGWSAPSPSRLGLFLGKWLLFRLTFLSGVVKLSSGDPVWRSLDALKYHFATQPLPTWIGWFVHQLPDFVLTAACAVMFAIELVLPFLIWAPRRLRHFACAGMLLLQVLILLTGNYTFFNWLTIALCLLLLSDDAWPAWLRNRVSCVPAPPASRHVWVRAAVPVAAWIILFCGAARMPYAFSATWSLPTPVGYVLRAFDPLRIGQNYGLFAVMTENRPEIILQGSMDGRKWETYGFAWKPGDVSRRPKFVAPHQPRLDWQLWFAAKGDVRASPWFIRMAHQILKGEEDVLDLLGHDPFDGKAPRYVRAVVYEYEFGTIGDRWKRGRWWKQGVAEPFLPMASLEDFE